VCVARYDAGTPVADGLGAGAAVPADELPEAVAGGVHARGAERAAAAAGSSAGALLRAAAAAHHGVRVVLRVGQRRPGLQLRQLRAATEEVRQRPGLRRGRVTVRGDDGRGRLRGGQARRAVVACDERGGDPPPGEGEA